MPADVGIDLVEDVGERDDVAGPLRHADLLAAPHHLDELTEHDLGLGRRPKPSASQPGLQRLDLAVVVGAPDVDEVVEPRPNLSRWYARSLQR